MRSEGEGPWVAFVSSNAQRGGAELYLERVISSVPIGERGRTYVLGEGPFVDRLADLGMDVRVIPTGRRLALAKSARELRRELRAEPPDVVHANGLKAALTAGLATIGMRLPVIWVKHDLAWEGPLTRLAARMSAAVVGVSETAVRSLKGRPGVRVIPNGVQLVDPDRGIDRAMVLDRSGSAEGDAIAVVSGRLCPSKGQSDALEAVAAAQELVDIPLCLVLLGSEDAFYPGYEQALREQAATLGIDDRVSFVPHVWDAADATRFLSGADVVLLPSKRERGGGWQEGFGLVAAEALAAGTPTVAYDNGSLAEVLGGCGIVVSEGDTAALAQGLVRVLCDRPAATRMAECGRARAAARFDLARSLAETRALYAEVARSQKAPTVPRPAS
jgi:glycosyltransferase involved in cell wall biosynthesis